jgi:hypothetical protein
MTEPTQLWMKNDKLISGSGKTTILKCDECPCDEMTVEISCPEYLHLLGGAKTLTITVTYTHPTVNSPLPLIRIYEVDPDAPLMVPSARTVCGTCLLMVTEQSEPYADFQSIMWDGVPGDKTRTWSYEVMGNHLPSTAAHKFGTISIEAFHPTKVDIEGEMVSVTQTPCNIDLDDNVVCSITAPSNVCKDELFDITISAEDRDGAALVRMDYATHESLFVGEGHRFDVLMDGDYDAADGTPSANWVEGVWTCTNVSLTADDATLAISLRDNAKESPEDPEIICCEHEVTAEACTMSVVFTMADSNLHTLGAAKDLVVDIIYDYPPGSTPPHPIFEVTWNDLNEDPSIVYDSSYLVDDGRDSFLDLSVAGAWVGAEDGGRHWEGKIRVDVCKHPDREHNITVTARHPVLMEPGGELHLLLANLSIYVDDKVTCDITQEDGTCAQMPTTLKIEAAGNHTGEALVRMDSLARMDLFNYEPYIRFHVDITTSVGSWEYLDDFLPWEAWVEGVWTCPRKVRTTSPLESVLTVKLLEYPGPVNDVLCTQDFTIEECGIDVSISCPGNLHTLGDAKDLSITVTFDHGEQADYLPTIQVLDEEGNPTSVLLDDDTGQPVAWGASVNWVAQGEDLTVWKLDVRVRIDSMPGAAGTETVTVQAFHPFRTDGMGEPEPLGSPCSISLSEEITCSISGLSEDICVDSVDEDDSRREFSLHIQAVGPGDETLTRMTYATYPGLFGRYGRFNVIISGASSPECLNTNEPWTSGSWDCSGLIASVGRVWVAVEDYDSISCEKSVIVDYCPDEGDPIPEPEPLRDPHLSPTAVPQLLHIHGQAYNLGFRISNFDAPIDIRSWNISAEWTLDGVVQGCPLVTSNNQPISLSGSRWDINGVWEEAVMAPPNIHFANGLYARVGLTVTAIGSVNVGDAPIELTTSVSIGVTKAYAVQIGATDTVRPGESFQLYLIARGPDFQQLIRVPESGPVGLQIEILDEDGEPADAYDEEHNPFSVVWQGDASWGMIYFSTEGTKYINARGDDAAGTLFEQATVMVSDEALDLARLAKAINERRSLWGDPPVEPGPDGSWDPWAVYTSWSGYARLRLRKAPKTDGTEGDTVSLEAPPAEPPWGSPEEVWAQYDSEVLTWAGTSYGEITQARWSDFSSYSTNAAMSARMWCTVGRIKQLTHTGERRCVLHCGTPDAIWSNEYASETKEGLWSRAIGHYVDQWAPGSLGSGSSLACSRGGYLECWYWGAEVADEVGNWVAVGVNGDSTVRSFDIRCTRPGGFSWTCYVWLKGTYQEGGATIPGVPAIPVDERRRVWVVAGSGSEVKNTPQLYPAMPPPPPCPSIPAQGPYGDTLVNPSWGASVSIYKAYIRHNFST